MFKLKIILLYTIFVINVCSSLAGISPVHDHRLKILSREPSEKYLLNSPHKSLKHWDNTILKVTKNVTQNSQMDEMLFQISKDLVSAILSKLEVQDKITRVTREALDAPGKSKGITAIETRRILDYISRVLSGNILTITRESTEPELHRLVYGLAQIAAEISIVSALKDVTYATALSKKQSVDLSLRRKRSLETIPSETVTAIAPENNALPTVYNIIMSKTSLPPAVKSINTENKSNADKSLYVPISPFSVLSRSNKKSLRVMNSQPTIYESRKGFLNQTVLDTENNNNNVNESDLIILDKTVNETNMVKSDTQTLDNQETSSNLMDDWMDPKDNIYKTGLNPDVVAEIEIEQPEIDEELKSEKRTKQKFERLESKSKKAILYAGDVAYLTAASVVAMRRALTASIEVQMSVRYAKSGMSNHQDLMMNLAKTAAQQAGKEAKNAVSKSMACERVIKLALKYTAQSQGANLNHVANRIVMDSLSLSTLAKSMAFVSSEIAINSLYQATYIKPAA